MSLLIPFFEWLGTTHGSVALHESQYMYLIVLGGHVLTLCLFVGTAVMLDLRLMGLTLQRVPVSEVAAQLVPLMGVGFLLMVVSGALLFYANPLYTFQNLFFRLKIVVLVLAGVNGVS